MTSESRCTYKYPPNSVLDAVGPRVVFECFALCEMASDFGGGLVYPSNSGAISPSAKHSKTTLGSTLSGPEFGGYL